MLRLLGILTLENMIFDGHRHHDHRRLSRHVGRGILPGTLLELFVSRANQDRISMTCRWYRACHMEVS